MDNFFIAQPPFSNQPNSSPLVKFINKWLGYLRLNYNLHPLPDSKVDMCTIEQRINYYHLLGNTIINNVGGDVIELGCFTGQCAMLFQKIMDENNSTKQLHLYDNFESKFTLSGSIEAALKKNFIEAGLALPVIHNGYFNETIPDKLPENISFVHIDCGFGGDPEKHKEILMYCLQQVYPRMSKGAICVLMDYHKQSDANGGCNYNPGVNMAADEFLSSLPEKIMSLYGNQYSHGYFRKPG
ncbi:MAG: TylF/MycF/NovP-related O-methyltransferase [Ferruginibacter sp.]